MILYDPIDVLVDVLTEIVRRFVGRLRDMARKSATKRFKKLVAHMPALIEEMIHDLNNRPDIRTFCKLQNEQVPQQDDGAGFCYYNSNHPDLDRNIEMLLTSGFIKDITTPDKNCQKYIFQEKFVDLVLSR